MGEAEAEFDAGAVRAVDGPTPLVEDDELALGVGVDDGVGPDDADALPCPGELGVALPVGVVVGDVLVGCELGPAVGLSTP